MADKTRGWGGDAKPRKLFQRKLLAWYEGSHRDLPWRQTHDPYRIWISEIMLQQTRVAAVISHYHRFLRRFPTIYKLASARESSVLAAWSGLGYYRRARMLHTAAKKVVREFAGEIPNSREQLMGLPGIGRYTSAAIASIAYGQPVAVVDGNIRRVLERLVGRPMLEQQLWRTAEQLLSRESPGDFNQALMELGAVICIPRDPKCSSCPVASQCITRGSLSKIANGTRQKKLTMWCALNCRNGSVFLVKRPEEAPLMPGLWELPEVAADQGVDSSSFTLRHSITVTDYTVRVTREPISGNSSGRWVKNNRVATLPLTGLARKILRTANVI
ncbi:MAG: A/G-specific adenine glycosylase [Terriglobales bacterium]